MSACAIVLFEYGLPSSFTDFTYLFRFEKFFAKTVNRPPFFRFIEISSACGAPKTYSPEHGSTG